MSNTFGSDAQKVAAISGQFFPIPDKKKGGEERDGYRYLAERIRYLLVDSPP